MVLVRLRCRPGRCHRRSPRPCRAEIPRVQDMTVERQAQLQTAHASLLSCEGFLRLLMQRQVVHGSTGTAQTLVRDVLQGSSLGVRPRSSGSVIVHAVPWQCACMAWHGVARPGSTANPVRPPRMCTSVDLHAGATHARHWTRPLFPCTSTGVEAALAMQRRGAAPRALRGYR